MVNATFDAQGNLYAPEGSTFPVYNSGDIAWILTSTALVFIMTPGVAFFYSGLLRRKNALQMLLFGLAIMGVASFEFFFWGYSLTFGAGSPFIGTLEYFGLMNVYEANSPGTAKLPAIVYMIYQNMFATVTPMIAFGAAADRGRVWPILVLVFLWATIVYNPIACWTWSASGWGFQLGALDFAGGGPVHMNSGTAALAYSLWLGKRRGYGSSSLNYKPNNVSYCVLGTVFLWFGWFGFNGGSALAANMRAAQACIVTNLAASVGGVTWMLLDWRIERKWSTVGFCSGAIAGLVGITPAAGFVSAPSSLAIGFVTAIACNFATKLKFLFRIDEPVDCFALHGIGGLVGNLLTGLFAEASIAALDGFSEIPGGWINQNYIQLGYQLAISVAIMAYSFVMTSILCIILNYIPGFKLRATEEDEIIGMDEAQLGELAYDYIWTEREAPLESSSKPSSISEEKATGSPTVASVVA